MPLWFPIPVFLAALWAAGPDAELPLARSHDNKDPAGVVAAGVLDVTLRIRQADWRPMGEDQPGAVMYAFAEGEGDPLVPGPLLRVRRGTLIRVRLENPTDEPFVVRGLSAHMRPAMDLVRLAPGESRVVEFPADAEGTYHYWGAVATSDTDVPTLEDRYASPAAVLGGAFVVDPREGEIAPDRIFMMNVYGHRWSPDTPDGAHGVLLTINGRPWPFTERVEAELGDTLDWRWINASERPHPMHLHGFYFQVTAKGDEAKDTLYWPSQRRMAVTETMDRGTTVRLRWVPDRPGAWLFHCHLTFHVVPNPVLGTVAPSQEEVATELLLGNAHHDPNHHVEQGMGGLMMAIRVHAPDGWQPPGGPRRTLRLLVQSDSTPAPDSASHLVAAGPYRRRFAFVLQDGDREPRPDSVQLPGSTLVLRKGEPTSIWVVNRMAEATSIHWHGLELDNYFDGVVGVGGMPGMPTPAVMPGDSFEVRLTPPRAGSFMYHTHLNDVRQQSGGLYGPIVILDEGAQWDPARDKVFIAGWSPEEVGVFLNGTQSPDTLEVREGETYRFRLMNVTLGNPTLRFRIVRNGDTGFWTPVAKDGFDLPEHQRVETRSERQVSIGETLDVQVRFNDPRAEYVLEARAGNGALFVAQPIKVLPARAGPGGN